MLSKKISFATGLICGLSFAPIFFTPGIFMLSILCRQIFLSETRYEAFKYSYFFGFGFFLSALYWIALGPAIFIEDFWWTIPFALFGLPLFIAIFIGIMGIFCWYAKESFYYHFIFALLWLLTEWVISWAFTGLPWAMLGYALSISEILIQSASLFSVFGLSFLIAYIGSIFYSNSSLKIRIFTTFLVLIFMIIYGYLRLNNIAVEFSNIKARIVQASIKQEIKWEEDKFWKNLDAHIELSKKPGDPNIIIWSEAALTVPISNKIILEYLMPIFVFDNQILMFGGISDNGAIGESFEIYSSLLAVTKEKEILLDYHKSHLVPFGEYIPLKKFIPLKKITHGLQDYTAGSREKVSLNPYNMQIQPLICYESIFPFEVRISNQDVDVMINITNDAWYGNSSGPYQHFEISRMRAIENGLPLLRAANNGISGVIDPLGRVIQKLNLNSIDILDEFIPKKLVYSTIFSKYGYISIIILLLLVLILQSLVIIVMKKRT